MKTSVLPLLTGQIIVRLYFALKVFNLILSGISSKTIVMTYQLDLAELPALFKFAEYLENHKDDLQNNHQKLYDFLVEEGFSDGEARRVSFKSSIYKQREDANLIR